MPAGQLPRPPPADPPARQRQRPRNCSPTECTEPSAHKPVRPLPRSPTLCALPCVTGAHVLASSSDASVAASPCSSLTHSDNTLPASTGAHSTVLHPTRRTSTDTAAAMGPPRQQRDRARTNSTLIGRRGTPQRNPRDRSVQIDTFCMSELTNNKAISAVPLGGSAPTRSRIGFVETGQTLVVAVLAS